MIRQTTIINAVVLIALAVYDTKGAAVALASYLVAYLVVLAVDHPRIIK